MWFVSGLLTLFGALVCAELASVFPKTGGVYVYLRESFSPALGFLWGWAMFWTMHTGTIAAVSMVFARYVGFFMPLDDVGIRIIAMSAIITLSAVNYVGEKGDGGPVRPRNHEICSGSASSHYISPPTRRGWTEVTSGQTDPARGL